MIKIDPDNLPAEAWVVTRAHMMRGQGPVRVVPVERASLNTMLYARTEGRSKKFLLSDRELFATEEEAKAEARRLAEMEIRRAYERYIEMRSRLQSFTNKKF